MPPKKSSKSTTQPTQTPRRRWFLRGATIKFLVVLLVAFAGWLIYLDAQVRFKFEGKRWALPAQVYARALEIYDGRALNLENLEHELQLLRYQKVPWQKASGQKTTAPQKPGTYSVQGQQVQIVSRPHQLPDGKYPAAHFGFTLQDDSVTNLSSFDRQATQIYTLEPFKMGGIYPTVKEDRVLLRHQDLPKDLLAGLLAVEDREFFQHRGLAPMSIVRAMWMNLQAGHVVQGGSTLTQQLVKNFYLSPEQSFSRKLNEAFMALLLEAHYDKNAILETYSNDIYLGQSGATAIHGFGMASLFYFAKELEYCELHELALLVALVKGPSYYDPRRYPERARQRRNLVLAEMRDQGQLSAKQYQQTAAQPLAVADRPRLQADRYPAFMDLVKRQLAVDYNEADLRTEGLKIYTSLDPQVQQRVEQAIARIVPQLARTNAVPELQAGAVVTAVGTGEVSALVGDRDPQFPGFNRALDSVRPIGSLVKPAVYLTALMQPDKYSLASLLQDQPFRIKAQDGQVWEPQNFDKKFHGSVPLYQSLANSYNVSTARLGLDLGIKSVHQTLHRLGVEKELNPYPSLFLGAQSLSPFEVSKFYQTIASNGFNMPLRAIREVTTATGELLSRYAIQVEQVFPAEAIYLLHRAMLETMRSGTGRSAFQELPVDLQVAGKTGTSNDNRDSWFAGFSGDYLGVVWLGLDNNDPMKLTGSSGALKVWTDFFRRVPQYSLAMVKPDEIEYHWFDNDTGELTDEQCLNAEPLPSWGEPKGVAYRSCQDGFSSIKGWIKSWF